MRSKFSALAIVLAIVITGLPLTELQALSDTSPIQLLVDTANPDQDGLFVLYGARRMGGEIGLPVAAGDLNGDGKADIAFCEMYANAGGSRINNGQVNIYLSSGQDTGFADQAQTPSEFSTLVGQNSGDLLGESVAIGDVNGDGFGDLIVSAQGHDGPNGDRTNAGAVYVAFGSSNFSMNADLLTADRNPPPGITAIYGPQANGRFGVWVDAGDVDGDGIQDLVIGMDQMDAQGQTHVGGAYIIFGSKSWPQVIDMASPPPGVRISKIVGVHDEDHWGACVHVGDINNDGIGDVVISGSIYRDSASYVEPDDQNGGENAAAASDGGLRPNCGEVYVLYGGANWPAEIDLSNPPASATHIIGANQYDYTGSQLFSADVNGDGKRDLIIGALEALAPDGAGRTGAVYVIYGSPGIAGATIDLQSPQSSGLYVSTIYGAQNLGCTGDSVRAYDINNDGMADLFIASPDATFTIDGQLREDAGDTEIILGRSDPLPQVIKLYSSSPGVGVYRLAGAHGDAQGLSGGDSFSYRLAGADFDGDGYIDYVANAMHGDGFSETLLHSGNVYIFSGKKLSEKLGILTSSPAPVISSASLMMNGQTSRQAPAGQPGLTIAVTGSGFGTSVQFSVNGAAVTASQQNATSATINLDQNPTILDTVGPLAVTAQNTNPPSAPSNSVTAGTLVGPTITAVTAKLKGSGALLIRIQGDGFPAESSVSVSDSNGQPVTVRGITVIDPTFIKAKIPPGQTPGSMLTVRVTLPSGVRSNSANLSVP